MKVDYLKREVCDCGHTPELHKNGKCGAMHCYCKVVK